MGFYSGGTGKTPWQVFQERNDLILPRMKKFYEDYQGTAAEHIREALGHHAPPMCEKEVKGAICQALEHGDPELIAEVIFEAMEWETAYAALKNIDE